MLEDFNVLLEVDGHPTIKYLHVQRTYDDDEATVDYTTFDAQKKLLDGGQLDIETESIQQVASEILAGYEGEQASCIVIIDGVDDLAEFGFTGM